MASKGESLLMARRIAHPIRKTFGINVRQRRNELSLSQEELAEKALLHQTYVSEIESAKRNVSLDNIGQIADALNVSAASLLIPR